MYLTTTDKECCFVEQRLQDHLARENTRRLLRESGIDQRGWLARQTCRVLCGIGHALVGLGRRLERYDLTQVTSVIPVQQPPRASRLI